MKKIDRVRKQRKNRVSRKVISRGSGLRLTVFRSGKHIYAQIVDDQKGKTLVSVSEKELSLSKTKEGKMTKTQKAKLVGEVLAQKAQKAKIKNVVFDRGYFKYHGRVKALADSAREAGLNF